MTLHLDIKGGGNVATGADSLDKYLTAYLGDEHIFAPGDLMGQSTDLVAKAMKGWPTLGDLRGQILICLTGNHQWKKDYSEMSLKSRLCFSDFDLGANSPLPDTTTGTRVFANMHHSLADDTSPRLRWLRDYPGFVSRVYEIDSSRNWHMVQKAGANVIATNRIRGSSWASVGDDPFASTLEEHAPP